jgi:hypothetical protein
MSTDEAFCFCLEAVYIRWDEVNSCPAASLPDIFIAREPFALPC